MRGDLHDGSQQRERAVPARVQRAARLHHLRDQVLDTPSVVLQRQVELDLATSEAIAVGMSASCWPWSTMAMGCER